MTYLLDANVLLALLIPEHEHNFAAEKWFQKIVTSRFHFATCPITEGAFIRIHPKYIPNKKISFGANTLSRFQEHHLHESWLENFSYQELDLHHIQGHKQLTDLWLVELARRNKGKLATFDRPLATLYPETVELLPLF